MQIVILHSDISPTAPPDEQDTLVQVEAVTRALRELGHAVQPLPFSLDIAATCAALRRAQPERVFNLVETIAGAAWVIYTAPAVLDEMRIPYCGCSTEAIFTATNKLVCKKLLAAAQIQTPPCHPLRPLRDGEAALLQPLIVKSVWEHGSVGLEESSVFLPHQEAALRARLQALPALDGWFAETYIDGREFNVSLIGDAAQPRVLPLAEMLFVDYPAERRKVVGYRAKWDPQSFECQHTVRSFAFPAAEQPLLMTIAEVARQVWRACELRGFARVDLRVDAHGQPWVIDVNTNPGIAPDSGLVAAAAQAGLSYRDLIQAVLQAQ